MPKTPRFRDLNDTNLADNGGMDISQRYVDSEVVSVPNTTYILDRFRMGVYAGNLPNVQRAVFNDSGKYSMKISNVGDIYTKLLLSMNGVNGGVSFPDHSKTNKTVLVTGTVNTSTTQKKFGTASGYFDGSSASLMVDSTDFIFNNEDFTIDMQVYPIAEVANKTLFYTSEFSIYHHSDGKVYFSVASANQIASNSAIPINAWTHVAIVKNGTVFKMYIDGIAQTQVYTNPTGFSTSQISLGSKFTGTTVTNYVSVVDRTNTYLYAATNESPCRIFKVRLSDYVIVASKTLASGENSAQALAIDSTYLYIGLDTDPGKVVRLTLSDFTTTAVKALTPIIEYGVSALAVDSSSTYLYIGLRTSPGNIIRLTLSDFSTTSTKTLASGENVVYALAIDSTNTYLYAGLYMNPSKIVRLTLADFTTTSTKTLAFDEFSMWSLAIDATNTYLYAGLGTDPGKIVRITLADFSTTSTKTLGSGEDQVRALAIDPTNTYLYIGINTSPGKVVRLTLSDFSTTYTKTFTTGENYARALSMDSTGTNMYVGIMESPKIYKIKLVDFTTSLTLTLSPGEISVFASAIDSTNTYLYAGLNTSPGKIVKIRLSDMTIIATKTLASGEDSIRVLAIDSTNTYLYAGLGTDPGKVVRLTLADFSTTSTKTLASGENSVTALAIDSTNTYLYAGLYMNPSKIVRLTLADFTTTSTKTLASGENYIWSLAIDSTNTYLYAGLGTYPGKIVRLTLADFSTTSTKTLASGENSVTALAVDSTNTYLYAGLDTGPGRIVRITLADFSTTSTKTLASGENYIRSLAIDPTNTYLYIGINTSPGKVVRLTLSDFSTTSTKTLASGENVVYALAIDSTNTYLYAGLNTSPAKIVKLALADQVSYLPVSSDVFNGYIDEARVSKGIARWTTNFTAPTTNYLIAGFDALQKLSMFEDCLGRTISLSIRVKATQATKMRALIYDGINISLSAYNVGTDWETLTVTHTISSSATILVFGMQAPSLIGGEIMYFTNVMLVFGSTPANYIPRSEAEEIQLCERYYQKTYNLSVAPGTATIYGQYVNVFLNTTDFYDLGRYLYRTRMRTAPTVKLYSTDGTADTFRMQDSLNIECTALGIGETSCILSSSTSAGTANYYIKGHIVLDAEENW
jgi:hypothetical protein